MFRDFFNPRLSNLQNCHELSIQIILAQLFTIKIVDTMIL